ncbi:T-cell activation Rho GTPase-activating protein-like [Spheniscus humboldti]
MGEHSSPVGERTPEGAKRARVSRLPSLKLLQKELSRRHAWRTFSARSLERLMEGQAEADPKQGPATVPSDNRGGLCRSPAGGSSGRRRRGLPWPFALRRTPAAAQAPGQAGSGCSRALFGQPLAALCGEDGTLPQPIQELLAVLQQEGPSTEGIFRRAASGTALRELREALDRGADVDLGSQPALLLAVILKDFLRSIPSKLLVNDLYEDWMAAMQKTSKEEKISELKAVAEKLPAANLLLLKRLLSLLQHIGHNASASRMSCSNLAICVGPNLLSPANEDLLPLEAMLEVAEKVKALVEFLVENCRDVVGEETTDLSCPPAEESPAPTERSSDLCLEEPSVPAVTADSEREAEALPHAPPSLLGVLKEAGGDTVVESEAGEVCQLPRHCDSVPGVGGAFLMRPSRCPAVELLPLWVIPPPPGTIRSTDTRQGCFSKALGMGFIKENAHKLPAERQRGVAVSFKGVLLRSYFVRASWGLFWGGGGGTVRNVADASQPKGSPLES